MYTGAGDIPPYETFEKWVRGAMYDPQMPPLDDDPEETLRWLLNKINQLGKGLGGLSPQEQSLLEELYKKLGWNKKNRNNYIGNSNLKDRAIELHKKLHFIKQNMTTTAVAEVDSLGYKVIYVGHSDPYIPKDIIKNLKEGERYVTTIKGHAEESIIKYAKKKGFKVLRIAASRDICNKCAEYIYLEDALPASDLEMPEIWKIIWNKLIK